MFFRALLATSALLAATTMAVANDNGKPAAAAASAPAAAASAPVAKTAAAGAAADQDRMVCKTERPMGSLIPKRICKTAAQWDAERESARKMMQDMQQRTGTTSSR